MTREENGIMRDAYYFLRDHNEPPACGAENEAAYWEQAAKDLAAAGKAWNRHPLATMVLMAIYDYLQVKSREKGEDAT